MFVKKKIWKVVSFPMARNIVETMYKVLFHYHKSKEELENLTLDEIQNCVNTDCESRRVMTVRELFLL